ncbi:LCP family protein [Streptacidiphilus carbonis]|uniref:LCP family protein n=1 Tax=Streptacidiphilus carbonis TaxID=105422 RepID=UPI0005AB7F91|nr:LCP family protein [Streptacidiphilus carbonis]
MTGTADRRGPEGEPQPQSYGYEQQAYGYGQYQDYPPQQQEPQEHQEHQEPVYQPEYGYDSYGRPIQQQGYADPGYQDPAYQDPAYQGSGYQNAPYQDPAYGYQQQGYQQPQYPDPAAYPSQYGQPQQTGQAQQTQQYGADPYPIPQQQPAPSVESVPTARTSPASGATGAAPAPTSEEFAFVDDAEESDDVIDWMKFSETRGERRDERRKQLRTRLIALAVVLVLLAAGGAGYLWLRGSSSSGAVAASTKRTVIAVHLHDLNKNIYTALLVSNPATGQGSTLLLPGTLAVPTDSGGASVSLASSVNAQGNAATRDGLHALLGADVSATWSLYTPFLQNLVDLLGGVSIDSNTTITQNGKTLVKPGKAIVNGAAAIAYADYQAAGESAGAQLARYGQVLAALVTAMPQDATSAASDITKMGAVADPSLPDATLGALMAALSKDAAAGKYDTRTLAVNANGTPASSAADMVKQLLGGTVTSSSGATAARVAITDATGSGNKVNLAEAAVVNGGFTLVPGSSKAPSTQSTSSITYSDDTRAADAKQLAQDLGLPATVVTKVTSSQSADLTVVLGKDYEG